MTTVRIALASSPLSSTVAEGTAYSLDAIAEAGSSDALIVCLPEAVIPGHRYPDRNIERATAEQIDDALHSVSQAARQAGVAVIAGIEEVVNDGSYLTSVVIGANGEILGKQRKVQLAPSEEAWYLAGDQRQLFTVGQLTFGISICHEGFRYPETVRWAAMGGAAVVFHPHFEGSEIPGDQPTEWCGPGGTYHDQAVVCRALENTIFMASCNYALPQQFSATCVVGPDGSLVDRLDYGQVGVLVVDIDLRTATAELAGRFRPEGLRYGR